ncbi:hypothetical protein N2152v2_004629 [Parachlorella kessleri]
MQQQATVPAVGSNSSCSTASHADPVLEPPSQHGQRFIPLRELGSGQFGVTLLMHDMLTGEQVAVKFLKRSRKVFLTPTHLGIVMDYASGGELFNRVAEVGAFPEDEARYFFQQLVSGVAWCHRQGVCHRDLKLENTLLDGGPAYRVKICDFGYSKNTARDSQPKTMCGTPAYIAPEVLMHKRYDGKIADVWSCGVTLYVMLVGQYPFEDPKRPNDYQETIKRILHARYSIPPHVRLSRECLDLLGRIFQADPAKRMTLDQLRQHPWFVENLPEELQDDSRFPQFAPQFRQSSGEIKALLAEAQAPEEPETMIMG